MLFHYSNSLNRSQRASERFGSPAAGFRYLVPGPVKPYVVRGVGSSPAFQRAIETKLAYEQISLQYVFVLSAAKQEAERKRIEAELAAEWELHQICLR